MLPNTAFYTGNMPDVHTKHILLYIIITQSNACFVTTKKKMYRWYQIAGLLYVTNIFETYTFRRISGGTKAALHSGTFDLNVDTDAC